MPIIPLVSPKGDPWELRVICWKVTDLNFRDKTSVDLFTSGLLEFKSVETDKMCRPVNRQDSDTQLFMEPQHYGSFHWRWIFPAEMPCNIPKLLVQAWDFELLTPNDAICECNLQLKGFFAAAEKKGGYHTVDLDLAMTHPNFRGIQGNVQMTLEMMTQEEAEGDPCDDGRANELLSRDGMYAYYRPPGAFPSFSLWPIIKARLMKYKKFCIICCIAIAVLLLVAAYLYISVMSDLRMKTNVMPWSSSKYSRLGLTPVQWEWNQNAAAYGLHGTSYGVIAQEVAELYSWPAATQGADGYLRVNYAYLNLLSVGESLLDILYLVGAPFWGGAH